MSVLTLRTVFLSFLVFFGAANRSLIEYSLQLTKKSVVVVSSIIMKAFIFYSRNTPSPDEQCLRAQSLLHPVCAQQPEGVGGAFDVGGGPNNQQVACQDIARICNNNPECKPRLEHYNQVCSVDSKTMTCAGPPDACRKGMIKILGTELRTNCGCEGTAADFRELYDCIGWHRSLWVNPCVGKTFFTHSRRIHIVWKLSKMSNLTTLWAKRAMLFEYV